MSDEAERFRRRDHISPTLLAALPFAVIGLLSACSPLVGSGPRIATCLGLILFALGLAIRGWPPARLVLIDREGVVRAADGRVLIAKIERLVLEAVGDSVVEPSHVRFRLVAQSAVGSTCVLLSENAPASVVAAATRLAQRLRLRVGMQLQMLGDPLPSAWASPTRATLMPRELMSRVPRYPGRLLWVGVGGCLFVLAVEASIVRAHWLRGGGLPLTSILLLAVLCGIALMLLHWGLRTRFWVEASPLPPSQPGQVKAGTDALELVSLGVFGRSAWTLSGGNTEKCWLVSTGLGGSSFLMMDRGNVIDSLRLIAPPDDRYESRVE
jgi:hypothetical protein